jgi:oligoendopeptidase F
MKKSTISIAVEVWNKYFAPVLGIKDSPLLAIYSHMIDSPLYLPNYSYGHVIQFQIEEYLKGKKFSNEIERIFKQGRLTPQQWMVGAVGSKISTQPVINALDKALKSE